MEKGNEMDKGKKPQEKKKRFDFDPKRPGELTKTYTVKAGDTLSMIAEKFYGDAAKYNDIYEANKDVLPSADDIKVGQELKIPPKK